MGAPFVKVCDAMLRLIQPASRCCWRSLDTISNGMPRSVIVGQDVLKLRSVVLLKAFVVGKLQVDML